MKTCGQTEPGGTTWKREMSENFFQTFFYREILYRRDMYRVRQKVAPQSIFLLFSHQLFGILI